MAVGLPCSILSKFLWTYFHCKWKHIMSYAPDCKIINLCFQNSKQVKQRYLVTKFFSMWYVLIFINIIMQNNKSKQLDLFSVINIVINREIYHCRKWLLGISRNLNKNVYRCCNKLGVDTKPQKPAFICWGHNNVFPYPNRISTYRH
jgi:hypothetical protein